MEDINDNIHEWFQAFSIIVVWNVDFVKLLSVLNNPNILKNVVLSYKENFQHLQKNWIEFS
jgi:hypothetical protein